MKGTELRIGNWVKNPFIEGEIEQVQSLRPIQALNTNFEINEDAQESFNPIPLSEEWLFRFGFESIGDLHPTFKKGAYLIEESLLRDGRYFLRQAINKEDSLCITLNGFKYVHQLQNLYFALTGKELDLTTN